MVIVLHGPAGGVDADDEGGVELEIDFTGYLLDCFPAELGIGDGVRAAHVGDAAMAERVEVGESLLDGEVMVEDDVGYVFDHAVGRDGDDGNGDCNVVGRGVEEQKAIDGALDQHARVFFDEVALPVVAGGEVEVMGGGELLDDAAHDAGKVTFAEVGGEDADAHGAALAQGTGEVVGAVIEPGGCFNDPIAGLLGDGLGGRGVIQDQGDRGL